MNAASTSATTQVLVVFTTSELSARVAYALQTDACDLEVHTASTVDAVKALAGHLESVALVVHLGEDTEEWRDLIEWAAFRDVVALDPDYRLSREAAAEMGVTYYTQSVAELRPGTIVERLSSSSSPADAPARESLPPDLGLEGFENLQDLVYVFDRDGNFVWWNNELEAVTGLSGEQIRSMAPSDFFRGDDETNVADAFRRASDGEHVRVQAEIVTASGRPRPYEFTAVRLERSHWGDAYVCGVGRDVSERVERERRINVLYRVLRHDIRTEVNIVTGYLDLLESAVETRESGEPFDVVRSHVHRLKSLAENAQRLRRVWEHQEQRRSVTVGDLVEDGIRPVASEHPEHVVEVETQVEATIACHPFASWAIEEAVENAVVHNDGRPTVTVRTHTREDEVCVVVEDDGVGIPLLETEAMQSLEESQLIHGQGLGLQIIYWATEAAGGSVTIEDREPRGTSVTMAFPIVG